MCTCATLFLSFIHPKNFTISFFLSNHNLPSKRDIACLILLSNPIYLYFLTIFFLPFFTSLSIMLYKEILNLGVDYPEILFKLLRKTLVEKCYSNQEKVKTKLLKVCFIKMILRCLRV